MLFSKLRAKSDELLPPPPPFPSMELEEEEKPKAKPAKAKAVSKNEFEDLFKEVESLKLESEAKREKSKRVEIKKPIAKIKEKVKPVKVKPAKLLKTKFVKKLPEIKIKASAIKPIKAEPKLKELEEPKTEDFEFPELEETKELESIGKIEAKPREIQEAEEEIKGAIEKIKEREKPSLLKKLFAREKTEEPSIYEKDDISAINSMIGKARQALMKFDLGTAKQTYIEIMKIYNKISPEEQAKVYQEIKDLYYERKSAEELKV